MNKLVLMLGIFVTTLMGFSASAQETPRYTGLYGGLGGGYGDFDAGGSGGYADVFIGLRKQMPSGLVFGVEVAANAIDSNNLSTFLDIGDSSSIIGKLGYTSDNRLMWYGGIGFTEVNVTDVPGGVPQGVVFEGGLEYMTTSYFGFRVRSQYHAVGNNSNVTNIGGAIFLSF